MNKRRKVSLSKKIEESETEIETEEETETIPTSSEEEEVIEQNMENITEQPKTSSFIIRTTSSTMYFIYDATKIYILWVVMHYGASQIYAPVCSPYSLWGFIVTPILAVTPQCKALRWIINTGGNTMETMWFILGAWFCTKIIPYASSSFTNKNHKR
uniref:Transmembrane protein n=1 Tax=viral metagenome TaxID=1070528 RepID=A0A6C0KY56_9ZZZZ